MSRVAVCSRSFSRHPILRRELVARYPNATFNDAGASLVGGALIDFLSGHDKAVIALERIDADVMAALPDLRVISKYGVGFDGIDLDALINTRVELGWTGGVNRTSVAELVIGFAISLLRLVPQANAEVRAGTWKQAVGRQLSARTVGIVGCGHVGKELARMLRAGFGCEVLLNDIEDRTEFARAVGAAQVDLPTLLNRADVISLHLPLDVTTRGLFDAETLAQMRPDAILINTARGGLVDELALERALGAGFLAGAAFDVFAVEPPEDNALIALPNFIVTPHIGGSAEEAILAMGRAAIDGLGDHRLPERGAFPPGKW